MTSLFWYLVLFFFLKIHKLKKVCIVTAVTGCYFQFPDDVIAASGVSVRVQIWLWALSVLPFTFIISWQYFSQYLGGAGRSSTTFFVLFCVREIEIMPDMNETKNLATLTGPVVCFAWTSACLNMCCFAVWYIEKLTFHKFIKTMDGMKVKVLVRNPDDYLRETKQDIHKCIICCLLCFVLWCM